MFLGREKELHMLNDLYRQNGFGMFILYGRRRVGKTTFLKEFCKGKKHIFYSAEQSNEKLNLDKFSSLVFDHYGINTLEPFSGWDKALLFINDRQQDEKLVLVFDEFPYLANITPSLLSVLQHLIDHHLQSGKLFLILCGSYMGFMEKEVLGVKSPLFGRRTGQLYMKPFHYKTSVRFLRGFSLIEQLILYGVYGGTAMYLNQIRDKLTVKDNILHSFLSPTGYLYEEPMLLLRQELQEPGVYYAIIEAVACGASKANDIATKTGESSAKCLKYIRILCELGILYKEHPFGEKETSRKTLYHISDHMFRFWFRYVSPNRTLLETDAKELVWTRRIEPDLSNYMGRVFETICMDYLLDRNAQGSLPLLFTKIGRWWGTDPKTHSQVEIDLVACEGDDYIFGECKWRDQQVDVSVYKELKEKADVFRRHRGHTWFILFSKTGFTEYMIEYAKSEKNVLLVTAEDMMR